MLPVIDDEIFGYRKVNVASQKQDPDSLFNWLKNTLELRKQHPCLAEGQVKYCSPENKNILAYSRSSEDESILVISNFSKDPQLVSFAELGYSNQQLMPILTSEQYNIGRQEVTFD